MHRLWHDRPWILRVVALATALAAVLLLSALAGRTLRSFEATAGDLAWRLGASAAVERRLVIVDIDEASLRQEGAWPWPRPTLARLSEAIQSAGAAVQAFDMVFPEPKPGDDALAKAWASRPVVLGQIFSLDPAVSPRVGQPVGALGVPRDAAQADGCPAGAARSYGVIANAAALVGGQSVAGHMTPYIERDGVVRRVPALICHEGRLYPSLALATLARVAAGGVAGPAQAADWRLVDAPSAGHAAGGWLAPAGWVSSPALPGLMVPVDAQGDMRVPYRARREALTSISASELLSGRADASLLRGAVVLVGATAFGIGDAVATPLSSVAAGVEVHAQSIAGLLDGRVPYQPRRAVAVSALATLTIAAILLLFVARRRAPPVKSLPLVGLGLAGLVAIGSAWALLQADLWLPWAEPALFALAAASALAAAEHAITRAQRERLSAHLQAYLPQPVAHRLALTEPSGALDVVRRDISVLAAGIRNFSAFAAHSAPERTAAVLHAFCSAAVEVVERHGGVVENVSGETILAVWNAYGDCEDHAQRAMQAGQELLVATRELFAPRQWPVEASELQPLALDIGLESGPAILGSYGPARRRAHAAIGEPVTVATRLQSMTSDLSVPILVGPRMASLLPGDATRSQGEFLLEGLSRHCALFAPASWAEWMPPGSIWPASPKSADDTVPDVDGEPPAGLAGPRRALGDA